MDDLATLRDMSDVALMFAIARYRQEALAEVYRRHGGAVYALARRLLSSNALAEDVTQEVLLRLWNAPDRFDPVRGTLRSFLLAQTHGRAIDVLRADESRRRREQRDSLLTAEGGYDVEHEVLDLTTAERVRAAMEALPQLERDAIELAYFGGHTYREVAALLNVPEGTVKGRIRSGLRRLRGALVDAEAGE